MYWAVFLLISVLVFVAWANWVQVRRDYKIQVDLVRNKGNDINEFRLNFKYRSFTVFNIILSLGVLIWGIVADMLGNPVYWFLFAISFLFAVGTIYRVNTSKLLFVNDVFEYRHGSLHGNINLRDVKKAVYNLTNIAIYTDNDSKPSVLIPADFEKIPLIVAKLNGKN